MGLDWLGWGAIIILRALIIFVLEFNGYFLRSVSALRIVVGVEDLCIIQARYGYVYCNSQDILIAR